MCCAVANVVSWTVQPAQRVPSTLDLLEIGSPLSQMKRTGSYIRLCWAWRWPLNYSKATRSVAKSPALLMQTNRRLLHGHKQISLCRGVSKLIFLFTRKWNGLDSKVISLRFVGLHFIVGTYGSLPCSCIALMYMHLLLEKDGSTTVSVILKCSCIRIGTWTVGGWCVERNDT